VDQLDNPVAIADEVDIAAKLPASVDAPTADAVDVPLHPPVLWSALEPMPEIDPEQALDAILCAVAEPTPNAAPKPLLEPAACVVVDGLAFAVEVEPLEPAL
jgi:hypothetical protein